MRKDGKKSMRDNFDDEKKHLKKQDHKWIKEQRLNPDGNEKEQFKKVDSKRNKKSVITCTMMKKNS